jgi:dolichol-phosphate mannosyltransferase
VAAERPDPVQPEVHGHGESDRDGLGERLGEAARLDEQRQQPGLHGEPQQRDREEAWALAAFGAAAGGEGPVPVPQEVVRDGHEEAEHGGREVVHAREVGDGEHGEVDDPARRADRAEPHELEPDAAGLGVWLVLPTYDEAENLEALLAAVLPQLAATGHPHRVLVVDDGSPDGTGDIAERLAAHDPAIAVLRRTAREGLGPAYIAGFRFALAHGASHVVAMDADFSHDPADVPRLVAATAGAGVVLGSRYVPQGHTVGWPLARRVISRAGCLYARSLLDMDVNDLTSGFRCYRRGALEAIDLSAIRARGYAFQIEMAYRAARAGFRIEEVPITFRERVAGRSKMTPRIALEAAWRVPALRIAARGA